MIIIILILLLIIIFLLFRCCRCGGRPQVRIKAYPNEVIVWKRPDIPHDQFVSWLHRLTDSINEKGEITDTAYCPNCDSDLVLLKGPGPEAFIQQNGSGGSGGTPPGTPVGGDAPGLYCANVDVSDPSLQSLPTLTDSLGQQFLHSHSVQAGNGGAIFPGNPGPANPGNGNAVTVAVLDTGDSTVQKIYVRGVSQSCLLDPGSKKGWNFVAGSSDTHDDYQNRHGAKVTQFIIDQVRQYQGTMVPATNDVNILPVKVFDRSGKGRLFDILCGIAYSANSGAKIINASFGFYEYQDTLTNQVAAVMLQEYMAYYLPKNKILMVAAAGNDNPHEDTLYRNRTGNPSADPRDLNSNPFYPACLVKDPQLKDNLLIVTTVSKDSVSPLQNFSNRIVDIGVNCDAVIDSLGVLYYIFRDPIFTQPYLVTDGSGNKAFYLHTVTGTSFATPIATGKIAAYYQKLISTGPLKKDDILNRLQGIQPFSTSPKHLLQPASPGSNLRKLVKDGNTSVKKENN